MSTIDRLWIYLGIIALGNAINGNVIASGSTGLAMSIVFAAAVITSKPKED